ncbi:MAG: class II glutamine amidotransferase [Elusimicrobiales bacterium]|nr:class II glutamine amidotransferase [Elusimicrobiales bacterium]
MCRITAVISARPASHGDLLCGGPKSLLAQAGAVKGRYQDDGWGVAWYRGGKPALVRSEGAARLEKDAFAAAAGKAASRVTLAHLRYASAPGVPKAAQVRPENTQPFSACGLAFAHNGTLFIKDEIRSLLGKYAARVRGTNDSEVLFWQVVKMLDAYGEPEAALEAALDEIRTVWISCKDKYRGKDAPYRGLNLFLASPDSLTVLCHAPRKKRLGALLTPGWDYGAIAWRSEAGRTVFSSEPADGGPWKKMNDPEIASARARGGRIELSFKRIAL